MIARIVTPLILWLLKRADLSVEQRNLCTTALLDKLGALPFRDILVTDELGNTLVNGVPLDYDQARKLHEGAKVALNNPALKMVWESAAFLAANYGVMKAESERQMFWGRACLWMLQQEQSILTRLAQE